jgi:hypothetical protein
MFPQELTDKLKAEIKKTYDDGAWSPLQLSYKFNVEVDQILIAIDQPEMTEVVLGGDQIDDAGPGVQLNYGTKQKIKFTKN